MTVVVSLESIAPLVTERGPTSFIRRALGRASGARQLGVSHMELPAGARSWPLHWHAANEEAIYVLEGEATLRLGADTHRVRAGDFVALPVGPDHAHQLVNDSGAPVRYLVISTMIPTDVTVYPESGKIGVFGGGAPGAEPSARFLSRFVKDAEVGYWDDEG